MRKLFGLTGSKGSGKTQTCMKLAHELSDQNILIKGFYSPAMFEDGIKFGIDTVSLPSFERRTLARVGVVDGHIRLGKWSMDPETFMWINQSLDKMSTAEVLIFDEIGPLEVEQKAGWCKTLDLIEEAEYDLAVITFRPDYVALFKEKFPHMCIFNVDQSDARTAFKAAVDQALRGGLGYE